MNEFDLTMLRFVVTVAAASFALGILGLAIAWVASRFSADPEGNWDGFYSEFRWAFGNALRLWRDMFCAPVTGMRLAWRREDRRRRAHRRARG